jgi:hypothetical protein
VAIGCLILQAGCSWLSDPATRLAYCLEGAVSQQSREGTTTEASCDLEMPGSYMVVLHPEGTLRDEQLVSAGLPPALLPELRLLRSDGGHPAIYVIATDPGVNGTGTSRSILSTRTTYQDRFIEIDKLLLLAKSTQPVKVNIGGSREHRVIDALH